MGIREHILRMSNMNAKLKPMEFETFVIIYDMQPEN